MFVEALKVQSVVDPLFVFVNIVLLCKASLVKAPAVSTSRAILVSRMFVC
jgi:hypothetical protein